MYILNLFQPTLTDKQKEELFSKESFDEMMKKLNEKKEIEEIRNLEEVLADKLEVVYEKALKLNEKAEIYNLASKGETLKNLIDGIENIEGQLDDSLESFAKVEDSISQAWERMKPEAWESISEYYSDDEPEEENDDANESLKYYFDGHFATEGKNKTEKKTPLNHGSLAEIGQMIQREIAEEKATSEALKKAEEANKRAKDIATLRNLNYKKEKTEIIIPLSNDVLRKLGKAIKRAEQNE